MVFINSFSFFKNHRSIILEKSIHRPYSQIQCRCWPPLAATPSNPTPFLVPLSFTRIWTDLGIDEFVWFWCDLCFWTNLVVASAGDDKRISLCRKNWQTMGLFCCWYWCSWWWVVVIESGFWRKKKKAGMRKIEDRVKNVISHGFGSLRAKMTILPLSPSFLPTTYLSFFSSSDLPSSSSESIPLNQSYILQTSIELNKEQYVTLA